MVGEISTIYGDFGKPCVDGLRQKENAVAFGGKEVSSTEEMSHGEIEHFLTCARIGRLGICMEDGPCVVPVGYVYAKGKIFFHTCNTCAQEETKRAS